MDTGRSLSEQDVYDNNINDEDTSLKANKVK